MDQYHHSNTAPAAGSTAAFVTCTKCGASNPAVSEFCRQCGDSGVRPAVAATRAHRRSPLVVAFFASVLTAIPLICIHFAILSHRIKLHNEAMRRSTAELNLNLGKTQIALSAGKSALRDAEAERQRGLDQVSQSLKLSSLQSENARLKADAQAAARRIKVAEDKYEDIDLKLVNAKGEMRELREELEACNSKQARTMQKLTETESRLRSAEARNNRGNGYRP